MERLVGEWVCLKIKHSPLQIHKGIDLDRHVRPEVER